MRSENLNIVIWGLRRVRHSHRYIHKGFYDAFCRSGFTTYWVDNKRESLEFINTKSLVLASNIDSNNLILNQGAMYVLHNKEPNELIHGNRYLQLQVHTISASGEKLGTSAATWDQKSRTLYQPWGIPIPEKLWLPPMRKTKKTEHWVGSIWNNSSNQGNLNEIQEYKSALKLNNIKFQRHGGTKGFSRSGVSDQKAMKLSNISPISAAIVGNWQSSNQYIPCRLFKNVASGALPTSNGDMSIIFGDLGIWNSDIETIVSNVLDYNYESKRKVVEESQMIIKKYTYEESIKRILEMF